MGNRLEVKFELNDERSRLVRKFFNSTEVEWYEQFYKDNGIEEFGTEEGLNATDLILDKLKERKEGERVLTVELSDAEIYSFTEFLNCLVKEEIQEVFQEDFITQEVRECNDAFWSMYTTLKKL